MSKLYFQVILMGETPDPTHPSKVSSENKQPSAYEGRFPPKEGVSHADEIILETPSIAAAVAAVREARLLNLIAIEHAELRVLYAYESQCNLEFSADEIAAMASERVTLSISCWSDAR